MGVPNPHLSRSTPYCPACGATADESEQFCCHAVVDRSVLLSPAPVRRRRRCDLHPPTATISAALPRRPTRILAGTGWAAARRGGRVGHHRLRGILAPLMKPDESGVGSTLTLATCTAKRAFGADLAANVEVDGAAGFRRRVGWFPLTLTVIVLALSVACSGGATPATTSLLGSARRCCLTARVFGIGCWSRHHLSQRQRETRKWVRPGVSQASRGQAHSASSIAVAVPRISDQCLRARAGGLPAPRLVVPSMRGFHDWLCRTSLRVRSDVRHAAHRRPRGVPVLSFGEDTINRERSEPGRYLHDRRHGVRPLGQRRRLGPGSGRRRLLRRRRLDQDGRRLGAAK